MNQKPYLSVIIPAYNESKRLPLTIIDIDKHLQKVPFEYEIIVVDNNSKDATKDIAKRFSSIVKNMRVIECRAQGKGAAVRKGMLESNGQIRLFTDADNSVSVDQFLKMQHLFREGYDVVIGSRDVEGAKMEPAQPWYRRLLGNLGNIFIQIVLLRGIKDTQCGFKAFSEKAALKVFPLAIIDGWGFDVEVLALANMFGYKIKEMPVVWVNSADSKVKPTAYILVLLEVVKIKMRMLRKVYLKKSQQIIG
jgi:dolichyl-phosphate beta-glucosyltransferase